jgi:hypothetical protein
MLGAGEGKKKGCMERRRAGRDGRKEGWTDLGKEEQKYNKPHEYRENASPVEGQLSPLT